MKKIISLTLCVIMAMAIATCAFAGKLPGGAIVMPPKEVLDFGTLVNAISDPVTLADKEAIEAAEAYYATMSDEHKDVQSVKDGHAVVVAARATYDRLAAAQNPGSGEGETILPGTGEGGNTDPGTGEGGTTDPGNGDDKIDENGDGTMMVFAVLALSMTAMVVLVSKKRAF